jgi:16S rRNA (cytosine967-C5)-methyltransferase
VELAKRWGMPTWRGFANGVLRALSRQITDQYTEQAGPRAVPVGEQRYRLLTEDVFPDPKTDPAAHFAAAFSFPRWLVDRWHARFSAIELERVGFWFNSPARTCLRVNRLKTTRVAWLAAFASRGFAAHPGSLDDAVWVDESCRVESLPGFAEGEITVQDESAIQAGILLGPQPGERVLDLCSAPGGKTTHLAECMSNRGQILAVDIHADRLAMVDAACARLGIGIVKTSLQSANLEQLPAGPFDAVLADVPCSNTGVLGKRPDARWRIQPADLPELTELQFRLARLAADRLRPGGRMVYSTCSIEPEENSGLVRRLLSEVLDLQFISEVVHRPGAPGDGGYQALLRRES